jgi:biotin carboxyl carrier protein
MENGRTGRGGQSLGAFVKKLQVSSDGKTYQFELRADNGYVIVRSEGQEHRVDLIHLKNNRYSILVNGRSFEIGVDPQAGGYTVFSGARAGNFVVEDFDIARLKEKAGIKAGTALRQLTAPMPGMIIQIHCQPGDLVTKDQPLLVMEAMKMENDIKAPLAGKIKAIRAVIGKSVDKGQILVEFE